MHVDLNRVVCSNGGTCIPSLKKKSVTAEFFFLIFCAFLLHLCYVVIDSPNAEIKFYFKTIYTPLCLCVANSKITYQKLDEQS